uniref:Rad60/SUMO-like domain-containing protein n=1 Tax=Leersia perrieri TaxID=77586 RepID=A0A0D9V2R5_9ORYZ
MARAKKKNPPPESARATKSSKNTQHDHQIQNPPSNSAARAPLPSLQPKSPQKNHRISGGEREESPPTLSRLVIPMAAAAADEEELEPLFDYSRVQPTMAFSFDDTDIEKSDIFVHCHKRRKVDDAGGGGSAEEGDKADQQAAASAKATARTVDLEENWLPSPPKPKSTVRPEIEEDSLLRELRLYKQRLAKIAEESANDVLEKVTETARQKVEARKTLEHIDLDKSPERHVENAREKVVITVQNKAGEQQFRLYKDEKFDKLFRAYAKKNNLSLSALTFVFDGEKVNPASTPEELGLEDEDMIEVD